MSGDEEVVWHTYSGRRHRFGPLIEPQRRYDYPYRIAKCNRSIAADQWAQEHAIPVDDCKRCFPIPVPVVDVASDGADDKETQR